MRPRTFIAVAAVGGLLAAGACVKREAAPADSAASAAMTDTGMGAAGTSSGATGTSASPTMSDTTATSTGVAGSGADTVKGARTSGDTTTRK